MYFRALCFQAQREPIMRLRVRFHDSKQSYLKCENVTANLFHLFFVFELPLQK